MDENSAAILFGSIRTVDEAYRLDDELTSIEQENFRSQNAGIGEQDSLPERVRTKISFRLYQTLKALEEKKLIDFNDQDKVRLFFQDAHKQIAAIPRLQIQVALEVNQQLLETIYSWVKQQVQEKILLDIVYKPQILAGCIVVYRGVFRDYSLRTSLKDQSKAIFQPILDKLSHSERPPELSVSS